MTHYNENPGIVRCEVFKANGKWYDTVALDMTEYYKTTITPIDAVILAIDDNGHYKCGADPFFEFPIIISFSRLSNFTPIAGRFDI